MKDLWKLFMANVGVIYGNFDKHVIDFYKSFLKASVPELMMETRGNHGHPKSSPVSFLMYQ